MLSFQKPVLVKSSQGDIIKVIPRVIIRNGYFWGLNPQTKELHFYENQQIQTNQPPPPKSNIQSIQKKMKKLRI